MATDKLKVMLSFMREINDGNIPTAKDYELTPKEFFRIVEACQEDGLIMNALKCQTLEEDYTPYILESAILTVKGLEYLHSHSKLMMTYKGLKELRSWILY